MATEDHDGEAAGPGRRSGVSTEGGVRACGDERVLARSGEQAEVQESDSVAGGFLLAGECGAEGEQVGAGAHASGDVLHRSTCNAEAIKESHSAMQTSDELNRRAKRLFCFDDPEGDGLEDDADCSGSAQLRFVDSDGQPGPPWGDAGKRRVMRRM